MTLKTMTKGALPVVLGGIALGLVLRYGNGIPFIEDARKGFNGDGVGLFN
jgi:hypothetical protein